MTDDDRQCRRTERNNCGSLWTLGVIGALLVHSVKETHGEVKEQFKRDIHLIAGPVRHFSQMAVIAGSWLFSRGH